MWLLEGDEDDDDKEPNRLRQGLMVVHSRAALLARTLVKAMDDFCETKTL